jgi:hypothetical protein
VFWGFDIFEVVSVRHTAVCEDCRLHRYRLLQFSIPDLQRTG